MLRNIRGVEGAKHLDAITSDVVRLHGCPARFLGTYRDTDLYVIRRHNTIFDVWLWRYVNLQQQEWISIANLQTRGMGALNNLRFDVDSLEEIAGDILHRCPVNVANVEEFHAYFSEYPTVQEVCAS